MSDEFCSCEQPSEVPAIGNPHSPRYRRDRVALGPFAEEPTALFGVVERRSDGMPAADGEIASNSAAWMVGALDAAGVTLGEFDRHVAALLAADSWSIVQVVAGWVARAHRSPDPPDGPLLTRS